MSVADRFGITEVVLPLGALVAGVLAWWGFVVALSIPPFILPSPAAVGTRLAETPTLYLENAWVTLERVVLGGAIGILSGFCLALCVSFVPVLRRAVYPYLVTMRVLPKIAIAPVLLIYFGTGAETALFFVALIAFFPMVVSTAAGLDSTPENALDLLRSVGAGETRTFVAIRLPYAVPDVFAGVKQSVTLAVVGAVVAEWIVATDGLGALVLFAAENVQIDVMLASVLVLFVLGLGLYGTVVLAQRRLAWDTS